MITTIATFRLATPVSFDEAQKIFQSTAPKYIDVPGLVRKMYIRSADGTTVGGIYLWRSRADAAALYTDSWREFVRGKYGTDPEITWFDSPVIVENVPGTITVNEPDKG